MASAAMRTASKSTTSDRPDDLREQLGFFGHAAKQLRRERGLKVEELAVRAGLSIRHVLLLEGGRVNEGFDTLCRLADALDVGLDALFRRMDTLGGAQ
jgi:transcriptional regulator with XRE-family HTH domain